MPRATNGPASRKRRKRILNESKGYHGKRKNLYRTAVEAVRKGWLYAFDGRKKKKGDFRSLWINRISIAVKQRGLSYSKFINGLKLANIILDRKMLAEIAVTDEKGFDAIVNQAKTFIVERH
ncbi:50S ribosomal protein L20 [bacterium]|nr:50S ribosomal protein L20 [bacterium]